VADYYAPRTDREAVLLTHALAWETNEMVKKVLVEHEDTRRRVVRIETVGKVGTVLVSVAGLGVGVAGLVLKVI
jgi:hypothetical protein